MFRSEVKKRGTVRWKEKESVFTTLDNGKCLAVVLRQGMMAWHWPLGKVFGYTGVMPCFVPEKPWWRYQFQSKPLRSCCRNCCFRLLLMLPRYCNGFIFFYSKLPRADLAEVHKYKHRLREREMESESKAIVGELWVVLCVRWLAGCLKDCFALKSTNWTTTDRRKLYWIVV